MWWHVSFGTSCYMLHLFQIHCPSQKDLTVPRPAHHQVRHPCRRFANSYDSPFRRFTRRLASGTHQLQMIKSATSTGLDSKAFTERNDTKPLYIHWNDRSTRLKGTSTCLSSDEDWDETSLGFMHDFAGKFGLFTFLPGKKIRKNEQFYKQTKFIFRLVLRQKGNTINFTLGLPVSESKKRVI